MQARPEIGGLSADFLGVYLWPVFGKFGATQRKSTKARNALA
jgi:hypothetical protein